MAIKSKRLVEIWAGWGWGEVCKSAPKSGEKTRYEGKRGMGRRNIPPFPCGCHSTDRKDTTIS